MKFTPEQLKSIEELATLYIRPSEIAVMMDLPEERFKEEIAVPDSPARRAYLRGKLAQKLEIRRQMATLARVGSPLALEMSERALLDMEDDE